MSDQALRALEGRNACLLANHGTIVCAPTLDRAMWLAVELETIAKQYYHSLLIGGPHLLSDAQIEETARKLAGYGASAPHPAPLPEGEGVRSAPPLPLGEGRGEGKRRALNDGSDRPRRPPRASRPARSRD
ncbi:MAG: class II aldolase/adducin family protein [Acetobacteraceae bacterium]